MVVEQSHGQGLRFKDQAILFDFEPNTLAIHMQVDESDRVD